jgi:hypothetical protein
MGKWALSLELYTPREIKLTGRNEILLCHIVPMHLETVDGNWRQSVRAGVAKLLWFLLDALNARPAERNLSSEELGKKSWEKNVWISRLLSTHETCHIRDVGYRMLKSFVWSFLSVTPSHLGGQHVDCYPFPFMVSLDVPVQSCTSSIQSLAVAMMGWSRLPAAAECPRSAVDLVENTRLDSPPLFLLNCDGANLNAPNRIDSSLHSVKF